MTIAVGESYRDIAKITHPSIKAYAEKIGADFIDIDRRKISTTTPHFEKFQIYFLLNKYDRIAFIDTDIIIRKDCPNLFDIVDPDKIGAFQEGAFMDRSEPMEMVSKQYKEDIDEWEGEYYNTGVMVVSRKHKFLFKKPEAEIINFFEQSYLNLLFLKQKVKMQNLPYKFNRMTVMDKFTGEHRRASYIVHYAGCPFYDQMHEIMQLDLETWEKEHPNYEYRHNIDLHVAGGLGDEICAEPVVRYMVETAYKDDNVFITTWYPRLFAHLPVPVCMAGKTKYKNDESYFRIDTMAQNKNPSWKYISPNLLHGTDYVSIMCLRGIIPDKDKQIKQKIFPEDEQELNNVIGNYNFTNCVIVHPGRGWVSKTFPREYWDEIIGSLNVKHDVILIGKHISDEQGTVDVEVPDDVTDVRNLLSIGGMFALLNKAPVLLSNDSAPVHLAGAFDNWIVLIPTCKHPDHVLPYRNGRRDYKTKSLFKKLTKDAYSHTPTVVHGQTIDKVKGDIIDYLPDVQNVIDEVSRSLMA